MKIDPPPPRNLFFEIANIWSERTLRDNELELGPLFTKQFNPEMK